MAVSWQDDSWKDDVRRKVLTHFQDNVEECTRILYALDLEESAHQQNAPSWRTLRNVLHSDKLFKSYASRVAAETKTDKKNAEYCETEEKVKKYYNAQLELPSSSNTLSEGAQQGFDLVRLDTACVVSRFAGFSRAMSLISVGTQRQMMQQLTQQIPRFIVARSVFTGAGGALTGIVNRVGGAVAMVALASITLCFKAIRSIRLWWKGKISGVRCCKNIVDAAASALGGIGGAVCGAAIGSFAGPVGTVVGGIAGGFQMTKVTNVLSDRLTQALFGVPKSVVLENAYNYFGVKMSASNCEINSAYRRRCLRHHPDKGSDGVDFEIVQVQMATIKAARDNL